MTSYKQAIYLGHKGLFELHVRPFITEDQSRLVVRFSSVEDKIYTKFLWLHFAAIVSTFFFMMQQVYTI